jgi:organic radical activating enzyme
MYKRKPGESLTEYRDRVLNTISTSFCAAKWYNATIWLGNGTTTSCHHPPAQDIPLEEIKDNPSAIHNTSHKKLMRKMMLEGKKPAECEYCWRVEGMGPDKVSDRVFKSIIYDEEDVQKLATLPWDTNVDLKTLEISFDRICNLACSYCNSSFSTTWGKDIKTNGPYKNLVSDGSGTYKLDGSWADTYKTNPEDNPYLQSFWKWWDASLNKNLEELRVTGGEPLLSPETWKLMDRFETQQLDMRLSINSNLMPREELITKFIEKSKNIKNIQVYTSCETVGAQAEYIRDGLKYDYWKGNLTRLITEGNFRDLNVMMTINSLCLFSITDFLDEMYGLKELAKNTDKRKQLLLSLNILRFPSFQSPLALPGHIKDYCRTRLQTWYDASKTRPLWHVDELASIERLIDYLVAVDAPHRRTSNKITLWRDFKSFYKQYDQRRGKSISVFPSILTDWFAQLPDTDTSTMTDEQIDEIALKEGWISHSENPARPGSSPDNSSL